MSPTGTLRGVAVAPVPGPIHRPPAVARALTALLGGAAFLATVALMLSDRAPGVLRRLFGDAAERISARIDAGTRNRLGVDGSLPRSDLIVHVGLWALVLVLVGLAVWSWRGLAVATALVGLASVAVEVGQGWLSDTREIEFADFAANGLGVAVGAVIVAAIYWTWDALARVIRR